LVAQINAKCTVV